MDNIITNPNEEKFRKIRANNKGFKERIECVTGGVLFLEAIGFTKELLPHQGICICIYYIHMYNYTVLLIHVVLVNK